MAGEVNDWVATEERAREVQVVNYHPLEAGGLQLTRKSRRVRLVDGSPAIRR